MKLFSYIVLILFGFIAKTVSTKHTQEHIETFKKKMVECKSEQNVTDDVVAKFIGKEMGPEVKCYAACVMQKVGLLSDSNTINKDVAMKGVVDFFGDNPELMKKIETIIDSCSAETDSNKCDAIVTIFTCLESKRIEEGIEVLI